VLGGPLEWVLVLVTPLALIVTWGVSRRRGKGLPAGSTGTGQDEVNEVGPGNATTGAAPENPAT